MGRWRGLLGAVIVVILAVAGGLIAAWIVANMRAVPNPVALVSPTPTISATASVPGQTSAPSERPTVAPRFTPTPPPTVEVTAQPFVHVVQSGETLISIATDYQVFVDDIVDP